MADTTVERLAVLIEANTKSYERAMARLEQTTNRSIRASNRAVQSLDARLKSLSAQARNTAAIFGLSFGASAIVRSIGNAIAAVSELGDAAETASMSAQFLQVWRTHLEQNGASVRDADDAAKRFTRRLGEFANSGGGPAATALKALNVEVLDANGNLRDSEDVLREVVTKLGNVEDQARVSALAAQLFGDDAGPRLLQALSKGIDGLDQTEERMRRLGILMSDEMVQSAKDINDQFNFFSQIVATRFQQAVLTAIGTANNGQIAFEQFAGQIGDFFDLIARNIHLLDNVVGALAGWMIFGPIGALVGALVPELIGLFNAETDVERATRLHEQALADLNTEISTAGGASAERVEQLIAEKEAALDAAEANILLIESWMASSRRSGGHSAEDWSEPDLAVVLSDGTVVTPEEAAQMLNVLTSELFALNDAIRRLRGEPVYGPTLPAVEPPAGWTPPPSSSGSATNAIADTIRALEQERAQLGLTARAQAMLNALQRAGIDGHHEQAGAVMAAAAALYDEEQAMLAASEAAEKLQQSLDELKAIARDALKGFLDDLKEGKTAGEALANMLDNIANKLLDMALDLAINMLFNALGSALGGGSATGSPLDLVAALGGRAGGGHVAAGVPYMVGERGPELFIPHATGTVRTSANSNMPANVDVNIYNNTGGAVSHRQSRSSDGSRIDVFIDEVVAGNVASPGSKTHRALRGTFGARMPTTGRG